MRLCQCPMRRASALLDGRFWNGQPSSESTLAIDTLGGRQVSRIPKSHASAAHEPRFEFAVPVSRGRREAISSSLQLLTLLVRDRGDVARLHSQFSHIGFVRTPSCLVLFLSRLLCLEQILAFRWQRVVHIRFCHVDSRCRCAAGL